MISSDLLAQGREPATTPPVRVVRPGADVVEVIPTGAGGVAQVFSRRQSVREFGGRLRTEVKNGLILPNGKEIALRDGEWFGGQTEPNRYWTRLTRQDSSGSTTQVRIYRLAGSALRLLHQAELPGSEFGLQPLPGTPNWLYDDTYEGLGYEVTVLDANLRERGRYAPLTEGFQDVRTDVGTGRVGVLIQPLEPDAPLRVACLDTRSGRLLYEREVPRQGRNVVAVSVAGAYLLACFSQSDTARVSRSRFETWCYDAQGNVRWQRAMNLDQFAVSLTPTAETLAFYDDETVKLVGLSDGKTRWEKRIMDFHPIRQPEFMGLPVALRVSATGQLRLLVKDYPTTEAPKAELAKSTRHATLYTLSPAGKVTSKRPVGALHYAARLVENPDVLVVVDGTESEAIPEKRTVNENQLWPVSSSVASGQGTITGTVGERRGAGPGVVQIKDKNGNYVYKWRMHYGIDITGDNLNVYTVEAGIIKSVQKKAGAPGDFIQIGDLQYFHILPGKTVEEKTVKDRDGKEKQVPTETEWAVGFPIKRGELLGTMESGGGWAVHVHMQKSGNSPNYLRNGFGLDAAWTFTDIVKPVVQKNGIAFHKGVVSATEGPQGDHTFLTQTKMGDDRFKKGKIQVGGKTKEVVILYGNADIVTNAYDPRVAPDGGDATGGQTAPHRLGFTVTSADFIGPLDPAKFMKSGKRSTFPMIEFENYQIDAGREDKEKAKSRLFLASGAEISTPKWIVTNRYLNDVAEEDAWDTRKLPDGFYTVSVRADDIKGNTEKAEVEVYLDNKRTYIKKVRAGVTGQADTYLAQWTPDPANDNTILFSPPPKSKFKPKDKITISVLMSEPTQSLWLNFKGQSIPASGKTDPDGKAFSFQIEAPEKPQSEEELVFNGIGADGEETLAIAFVEDKKDIAKLRTAREAAGGSDKRHKLAFESCTETTKIDFTTDVKSSSSVYLNPTGGTPPYRYSIDGGTPQSNPIFTGLVKDKTYLFRVIDKEELCKTKDFTMKSSACNSSSGSGGQGTFTNDHQLGTESGAVAVNYQMYSIPDQMNLIYNGRVVASTGGLVSGTGRLSFTYVPKPGDPTFCTVQMVAPNSGTLWDYTINCPVEAVSTRLTADTAEPFTLRPSSDGRGVEVWPVSLVAAPVLYTLQYRQPGESAWQELPGVRLPYFLRLPANQEVEVKLRQETEPAPTSGTRLRIRPNPTRREALHLTFEAIETSPADVAVLDVAGRVLWQQSRMVREGTNTWTISLPATTLGVCLMRVSQAGAVWTQRVMILP